MAIKIIVAVSANGVIGNNGDIPWRGKLPADMDRFKGLTLNSSVLMGRKTYKSIPSKFRPLPDRHNIVLTKSATVSNLGPPDSSLSIVGSIEEGIGLSRTEDIYILGGASVYAATIHMASEIQLTLVHAEFEGDTFFPVIDTSIWTATERQDNLPDEKNTYAYSFIKLVAHR